MEIQVAFCLYQGYVHGGKKKGSELNLTVSASRWDVDELGSVPSENGYKQYNRCYYI